MKYINTSNLSIIVTNSKLSEPLYKLLIIDGEEHPILSVESKYWKQVNDDYPVEMTQVEKDAVDQAEADSEAQAVIDRKDFLNRINPLIKAFSLVILDEINALRTAAGLSERTQQQLVTAIKNKYE